MKNIDDIKDLLIQGDKEGAIKMLVSSLRLNGNDVEMWLLLSEVVDDPEKKRDCFKQVLKLSPNNLLALSGLESLTPSNSKLVEKSVTDIQDTQPRKVKSKEPVRDLRESFQYQQSSKPTYPFNYSKNSWKDGALSFLGTVLGISAFFGISFILGLILTSGDSSSDTDPLCMGMTCIGVIVGAFIVYSSWNARINRDEAAYAAIREQKQTSSLGTNASVSKGDAASCRVCQHTVSRTAPSCPNCGELYPGLISKCPYCGSHSIRITSKGFSLGKAAAGAVIAGPLGVAGGMHGRKDLEVNCSNCHQTFTIKHNAI